MSFLERTPVRPSDAELIARVRGGDKAAYGDLFEHHREAATRLARTLTRSGDADDLVAEAFTKVFRVLLGGGGPDLAFRAYLLTAIRRLHVDRTRAAQRSTPTDDIETLDSGVAFVDPAVAGFESGAAARAFQSLPERWQLVLWHLEVEGQKPAEIAPLLGMSPNSVSVLAYRAREGLRQAFLQMHAADVVDDGCEWTRGKLGAYVRKAASRRDAEKVEDHLTSCRPCTAVYLELTEVNSSLSAVLGPLVLGSAAVAYVGGGAAVTGAGTALGGVLGRVVDVVTANTQAAVVSGTVATVAAAGVVGVVVTQDDPGRPVGSEASGVPTAGPAEEPRAADPASPPPEPSETTMPEPPTAVAPPVAEVPAPEPVDDPPPAPDPAPEPVPQPRPEPTPEPSPDPKPSPAPQVDAAVEISVQRTWRHLLLPHMHSIFSVAVTGVPEGVTTPVRLTFDRVLLRRHRLPATCTRAGTHEITCTDVGNTTLRFDVRTRSFQPVTIRAILDPVPGDDRRANDSATAVSAVR